MVNTILWDWNGTLLNDTDVCIECMNVMLKQRQYPLLTKKRYREIFAFPVKNYYKDAGFNFNDESFDVVAIEFMDLYFAKLKDADIFPEAHEVLATFQQQKISQVLISAMEHNSLVNSVKEKGLFGYFNAIGGIQDHFAAGKTENAKLIVKRLNLNLSKTLLIGDTLHDLEVAKELGVKCLLVANGHQSAGRLKNQNCDVVENLTMVIEKISLQNIIHDVKN
jgi:phosphoglycolate phosphatase